MKAKYLLPAIVIAVGTAFSAEAADANSGALDPLNKLLAGGNLHVSNVEMLLDGGSYVVTLSADSSHPASIILLNEDRAARLGVHLAAYEHGHVHAPSPSGEALLRASIVQALHRSRFFSEDRSSQGENTRLLESALRSDTAVASNTIKWIR